MGGHERGACRPHRRGLGRVALERVHHQREPGGVGEQADHNLRIQAALFGEPGLAEPITGVGLEVEGGHVIKDQAGRAQPGMRPAGRRQRLPPRLGGKHRQAAVHCSVRGRLDTGFVQNPQRVQLAGRFDDARQHQGPEHLITIGHGIEPEKVIGAAERVPQVPHPRGRDRQRPTTSTGVQTQIELALTCGQALSRRRLKKLELRLVVSRPDVLNIPRPPPRRMHDLHRGSPRRRLHGAHVRHQHSLDRST